VLCYGACCGSGRRVVCGALFFKWLTGRGVGGGSIFLFKVHGRDVPKPTFFLERCWLRCGGVGGREGEVGECCAGASFSCNVVALRFASQWLIVKVIAF